MAIGDRNGLGTPGGSLVDVLRWRGEHQPERGAFTFLVDGDADAAHLTYGQLDWQARAIAAQLQARGASGERVLLVCPPGLQYVAAFFGCLYAGAVAVPAYPPRATRTIETLLAVVRDAAPRVALTTSETRAVVERGFGQAPDLGGIHVLNVDDLTSDRLGDPAAGWRHPSATRDTLAFLQYTSGSTGTPKGVMVSHGNLIANMTSGWDAVTMSADSIALSWLPPFHDMGLISGIIQPAYAGLPAVLMSPAAFIQRPSRWLRAISTYRATHSGGPPFAYGYCLRKIAPDQLRGVDLSSWVTAYVGAEPIQVETLERFAAAYAPYGLRPATLFPCYGMAEATLMVSGGPRTDRPTAATVDAAALAEDRVVPVLADAPGARRVAGCGHALGDTTVEIVHPERLTRCPPGAVGEIWVTSPAVAGGYWNQPEASAETFRAYLADAGDGPFMRTGDLGFVQDGELFVTGRLKDLVILRGKNHYPQDLEQTVERCHPAMRPAGGAAFSVDTEDGERLVVVQEVEAAGLPDLDAESAIGAIRQAIADEHDVTVHAVVLVRPGTIPKTSSGKIRRRACRAAYLAGTLGYIRPALTAGAVRPALTPWPWGDEPLTPQPPLPQAGEGESGTVTPTPSQRTRARVPATDSLPSSRMRERGSGGHGDQGAPRMVGGRPPTPESEGQPGANEIQRWLVARVAEILDIDPAAIDVREPFARYGLTSAEAVELSGDLEDWLGRQLSPTLAYDFPTVEAIARRLACEADDGPDPASRASDPDEPIAIIGLGCRLPGASSPHELWQLLRDGVDAIREVPADRWPLDTTYDPDPDAPGKLSTRFGGFLDRVDGFDADFFRIAPREAVAMDPQQRLLLEVTWEALEDAGQPPDRLEGTRTGVFMGIASADYGRLHIGSGDPTAIDAYSGTGVASSVAVGRISYVLGLHGPNLAVDTSCSSALVAIHLACQSLRDGECRLALAGGVNLILTPETSIFLSKARALAPDGRCKTFDAAADGYVRGEGCGVVALKRLSDALADGDRVLALIRGSAVNHDGRSNGLTAPNGVSQEAVIREALARAGIDPAEIGYVEAHGTGTALGDPIEVRSLAAVLSQDRPADRPFALGSIKTNVGHLEAAAGVAGLLKAVLALRRGLIPPHLHLRQPSPYIPWHELPVVVPTDLTPWPASYGRRFAAVSAFGFSGTNAHVVLEEAPTYPSAPDDRPVAGQPCLLPLSARTPAALRDLAAAYHRVLGPAGGIVALHDLCYTASVRRSHHEHRLAVVGASREELAEALEGFLRGEPAPGLVVGRATGAGAATAAGLDRRAASTSAPETPGSSEGADVDASIRLRAFAAEYVAGLTPDWQALYPNGGRCVPLPTYPWQRERFWAAGGRSSTGPRSSAGPAPESGHAPTSEAGLYPLLGRPVEPATAPGTLIWDLDLSTDALPVLRDHRVGGQPVFPAAGFLALLLAAAQQEAAGLYEVEAATFGQVLVLPEGKARHIQLVRTADTSGSPMLRVYGRDGETPGADAGWTLHAEGRIRISPRPAEPPVRVEMRQLRARCPEGLDPAAHYATLARHGLEYGAGFRRIGEVWRGDGEALGRLLPAPRSGPFVLDPALLDGAFQVLGAALSTNPSTNGLILPVGLDRLRLVDLTGLGGPVWCHAVASLSDSGDVPTGDLTLLAEDGRVVLEARGLRLRHLAASAPLASGRPRGPREGPLPAGGEGPPSGGLDLLAGYLAEIVASAVGRPAARIERDRPLSDLGLDSLMAMELRNRIQRDLGVAVSLATFLQGPTISELAAALAEDVASVPVALADVTSAAPRQPEVGVDSHGADVPLSPGQQALWLTHQLAPRSTAYHILFAARLAQPVDVPAMRHAVRALLDRHAALRTSYRLTSDGQPVQRVLPESPDAFTLLDAAGLEDAALRRLLDGEADRPFDLERGPLLRVTLVRRSESEHVLLLTVHHIAVDFWSLEILVGELLELYAAALADRPAALPAPADVPQYPDVVRWQRELLDGPAGDRLWCYWREKLAGELPVLNLPTDRPRPRLQTYRGALHDFQLDADTTRRLRDLARAEGATPYALLLAAFSALLARQTGLTDVLVGTPMAGRARADFERTVGYLVNVLPLRADLSGQPSFRALLRQTRDTVLEALDHQEYPFPLLVERLRPPRDPGQSPLVQVLFIWYRSPLLDDPGPDSPEVIAWEQRGAPYDLMLLMTEARGGLVGRLQYNADLFDPATIAALADRFCRLLAGALAEPDHPVMTLPLLSAAERTRLATWNDTEAPYPADACLHELFEAQAARTPDAVALVWQTERITYRELNRRANHLARRLRALSVGPEVLVGVCLDRTPALVAGLLAVLKAGGAYLPLDPAYPENRLASILADSGARVLLAERRHAPLLAGHAAEIVCLDDDPALTQSVEAGQPDQDDRPPASGVRPHNLAYVIYTSGSTGQPKGVAVEHRGPVALVAWAGDTFEPDDLAGVLASTSVCFDLSVFEIFAPLGNGGTVILAENVLQLPRLPAAAQVTLVNTVPSALAELLRAGSLPDAVRVVALAGEVLPRELADAAYQQPGVRSVYNLYGPTEDTTYTTWALVERGAPDPPPIGRPLANKRVYLLDAHRQPVPIGVPGEVYTAGVGVARGYLNRPELTAERFIPSPFGSGPFGSGAPERLYRVGDLARYRPDGSLEFLGRLDQQLKVRGFRIEPGEVEAALARHPAVREAAVVAREDRLGNRQLVAYLVGAEAEAVPTVGELRRFLQRDLPEYMVPSTLVWLPALPRMPNGKLDATALPLPGSDRPHLDAEYVSPRTPDEALLATIWSEVLGVARVGVYDSFFDLGGASLASVAIAAKANEAGLPLSPELLFAYPTIAELTALAVQQSDPVPASSPAADRPAEPAAPPVADPPTVADATTVALRVPT